MNVSTLRIGVGVFGLVFHDELPSEALELIKHLAREHDGGPDDLERAQQLGFPYLTQQDLVGTYYPGEAVDALVSAGWKLNYLGSSVSSLSDIEQINDRIDGQSRDGVGGDQ